MLFSLALALLVVDVTFLAGVNATDSPASCMAVAALIHYFLLVAFAWMLVEAILQYLKFVKVLDTYIHNFILKATIPAWGNSSAYAT